MATIVLSAAGMALGSSVGGTVLGLSAAAIGRTVGAVIGRRIDEKLLGSGSAPVETGRVDRFRLTGASEGAPLSQVHGRMRVAGQVIWSSRFAEDSETTGGGKGGSSTPKTTTYSYTVSMAVAVVRGPITRVGRVWADGVEVSPDDLNMRVYLGTDDQLPDAKIEAVEGVGLVPAYRGIAYVMFEDMPLGQFGNRVPQLSFEVFRPEETRPPAEAGDIAHLVQGVALIPGSGEYSLATTPVYLEPAFAEAVPANINSPSGKTDFLTSLDALTGELPQNSSVALVVSWFGDDLRCGHCTIRPKVEQQEVDADAMPWRVGDLTRASAELVPRSGGRPVYGGTPTDQSVVEAIHALNDAGQSVVYYPFILMDQLGDTALPNPYRPGQTQPALPWRGRITTETAPGIDGTTDATAAAEAEVAVFFGNAQPGHFTVHEGAVSYTGPAEWSFRRYILHQAALCSAAGGVDAFCIGSEMRGLTQIRGAGNTFPAVAALRVLAADVRSILGPDTKITYAADWSEYHGYQPEGTGDKFFHLDPLWADPNIDMIGIDNYMPLSDWRETEGHLDEGAGSVYDLEYLTANVAGGEGYDWFYHSQEARDAQLRTPITDGDGEPWVWRYKDLKGWWSHFHYDRIDGERVENASPWVPQSKPIWFTEYGCAAINNGTNQPNKFLDPKSSESTLPYYSNGQRDDYLQLQYLRAVSRHFADPEKNPVSEVYDAPMVDMSRAHVWAWDARPYPWFPAKDAVWSDGDNYEKGHWLNGRSTNRSLQSVVRDICAKAGVSAIETRDLHGVVRGYTLDDTQTGRQALQPLMLAYGFDVIERDGVLVFRNRSGLAHADLSRDEIVYDGEDATVWATRSAEAEVVGKVQLSFVSGEADYDAVTAEAIFPDERQTTLSASEVSLVLTEGEGQRIAERWLAEARLARDTVQFALPPSQSHIGAGDVVQLDPNGPLYRIDRAERTDHQALEAVRVEPMIYRPQQEIVSSARKPAAASNPPAAPVQAIFMDLPLLRGDEAPYAPHVAMTAKPWPGQVALYSSTDDEGFGTAELIERPSIVGTTLTDMASAAPGRWDHGPALRIRLVSGTLSSVAETQLLGGANVCAIGDGSPDAWEVFQFAKAELVAPQTYDVRLRLRGQAGTDGVMPAVWPAGSRVVVLNAVPRQIDLTAASRGVERTFRYGPASKPLSDPAYRVQTHAFAGVGLRPYPVAHLSVAASQGDLSVRWVRRTRVDGDLWGQTEVPLAEDSEAYVVRVVSGTGILREVEVSAPEWTYLQVDRLADAPQGPLHIEVAQISERFGPGPVRRIDL